MFHYIPGENIFVHGNTLSEAGNKRFTYRMYNTVFKDASGKVGD